MAWDRAGKVRRLFIRPIRSRILTLSVHGITDLLITNTTTTVRAKMGIGSARTANPG